MQPIAVFKELHRSEWPTEAELNQMLRHTCGRHDVFYFGETKNLLRTNHPQDHYKRRWWILQPRDLK